MNDELFLVNIKIKERTPNVYPFSVPSIMNAGELDFKAPVTVLSGGNGCGKTTLLEMIAESLRASRISEAGGQSDKAKIFTKYHKYWTVARSGKRMRSCFLFSSEDFTRYIEWTELEKRRAEAELMRIRLENDNDRYMAMPYLHTLADLEGMYDTSLSAQSHGQGFLEFFKGRLSSCGLYMLDEPEGALTFENQYLLSVMIIEAVKEGCQFLISTHSPIITAIPNADILYFTDDGIAHRRYEDLENIRFLEMFMKRRKSLFNYDE